MQRRPAHPRTHTTCKTVFGGLRSLIKAADAVLRRMGGITEFETDVKGLLRVELSHAAHIVVLSDRVRVERSAPIMDLHFWNEHLPAFPSEAENFDWASRVEQQIQTSLHRWFSTFAHTPNWIRCRRCARGCPSRKRVLLTYSAVSSWRLVSNRSRVRHQEYFGLCPFSKGSGSGC
jgi:hypothetical protein